MYVGRVSKELITAIETYNASFGANFSGLFMVRDGVTEKKLISRLRQGEIPVDDVIYTKLPQGAVT